jgi:soluble lytic murein transglycosylase-like protein
MSNWEEHYKPIIEEMGARFLLEPALVMAIIKVESNGDTMAYNPEGEWESDGWHGFWNNYIKDNPKFKDHYLGKYICLNGAFGLMQILAVRAMERGFGWDRDPSELWNPRVGILYGCLNLRMLLNRYKGNIWDAVAAYNQGNNRKFTSGNNKGKYFNYRYVEKVRKYYEEYNERLNNEGGSSSLEADK